MMHVFRGTLHNRELTSESGIVHLSLSLSSAPSSTVEEEAKEREASSRGSQQELGR